MTSIENHPPVLVLDGWMVGRLVCWLVGWLVRQEVTSLLNYKHMADVRLQNDNNERKYFTCGNRQPTHTQSGKLVTSYPAVSCQLAVNC